MKHRIPSTNWLWRAFIPMMLIVMFLIPKTVLAENALSWETYAQKVRIQEEAKGIYADWDIADKQDLIESLIQMNAMSESAATRRLLEGDLSTGYCQELCAKSLQAAERSVVMQWRDR